MDLPGIEAKALLVVSPTTREYIGGLVKHAKTVAITTPEAFRDAADLLNNITKQHNALNEQRLSLARLYDQARDENVNEPAKALLSDLMAWKVRTSEALAEWSEREEARKREKAFEQEQARRKLEQLRLEAETRQEVAEDAVVSAKGDAEFEEAAQAFDKGLEVMEQAREVGTALTASLTSPKKEVKAKGVAGQVAVTDLEVTDLSLLPLTYHQPNLKKITAHILDGTLKPGTPGLRFTVGKRFRATGR